MKIDEVVELPTGAVQFKAELTPEQTTAMVKWFITSMIQKGILKIQEEKKDEDTAVRH